MEYQADSPGFAEFIDRMRTGNYGEDAYIHSDFLCDKCGCDIEHESENAYDFNDLLLCEDCYREELFNTYKHEHETDLEDFYG